MKAVRSYDASIPSDILMMPFGFKNIISGGHSFSIKRWCVHNIDAGNRLLLPQEDPPGRGCEAVGTKEPIR